MFAPGHTQTLSSEQSILKNKITAFLKEDGLRPETKGEELISFIYDGCNYLIYIAPDERTPMFVSLAALFELPGDFSPLTVALAANELNNYKGVKVLCYDDSFSVQAEMFITDASTFIDVFYPLIHQIQSVLGSFTKACSNVNLDKVNSSPNTNKKGTTSNANTTTNGLKTTTVPEGVYYNPKVTGQLVSGAKIKRVTITDDYTCVEVSVNSTSDGITSEWCNIDGNTYIVNEDKPFEKLKLSRASGIKVAPDKTYFGGSNKTISFKLYFPPIPKDTKSLSLIEPDSSWCFYGITLHK